MSAETLHRFLPHLHIGGYLGSIAIGQDGRTLGNKIDRAHQSHYLSAPIEVNIDRDVVDESVFPDFPEGGVEKAEGIIFEVRLINLWRLFLQNERKRFDRLRPRNSWSHFPRYKKQGGTP